MYPADVGISPRRVPAPAPVSAGGNAAMRDATWLQFPVVESRAAGSAAWAGSGAALGRQLAEGSAVVPREVPVVDEPPPAPRRRRRKSQRLASLREARATVAGLCDGQT